jgi:hypothetical protein
LRYRSPSDARPLTYAPFEGLGRRIQRTRR